MGRSKPLPPARLIDPIRATEASLRSVSSEGPRSCYALDCFLRTGTDARWLTLTAPLGSRLRHPLDPRRTVNPFAERNDLQPSRTIDPFDEETRARRTIDCTDTIDPFEEFSPLDTIDPFVEPSRSKAGIDRALTLDPFITREKE